MSSKVIIAAMTAVIAAMITGADDLICVPGCDRTQAYL